MTRTLLLYFVFALLFCSPHKSIAAEDQLKIVTWTSTAGHHALWNDAVGGLQASVGLFNSHGGLGGRILTIDSLEASEDQAGFMDTLSKRLDQPRAIGLLGGSAHEKAAEISEHLKETKKPWLGPWSNEQVMYQGLESDPFAILPPWSQELPALLDHIRSYFEYDHKLSGPVFLIHSNSDQDRQMAQQAKDMAQVRGLNLKRAPINDDFVDWQFLAEHMQGAAAIIIWLNPGRTAACVKAAKSLQPDALYLTNSVNAPNRNLVILSGGAWNGMIFPAVLTPSRDISPAYESIIKKYGPANLDGSYQTYLGFAQGQILARALNLTSGSGTVNLTRSLYNMNGFPTLLAYPVNYIPGQNMNASRFYLGRAYGNGYWEKAPPPQNIEQKSTDSR